MTTEELCCCNRFLVNIIPKYYSIFRAIPGVEFSGWEKNKGEVEIVIHSGILQKVKLVAEKLGSAHLYKLINPAVKEVLRFYLQMEELMNCTR